MNLDEFTLAYITAALWSSNDESDEYGGEPLDKNYGPEDLAPETLEKFKADCAKFQEENKADLEEAERMAAEGKWSLPKGADCTVIQYAGHDFWLNRNGHGSGFWDGDWPGEMGDRLDEASKKYGTVDLIVGEDGLIYC